MTDIAGQKFFHKLAMITQILM